MAPNKAALVLDLDDTLICRKNLNVVKRPGLEAFLSKMAEAYVIVVFSASDEKHVSEAVAGFGEVANLISGVYSIKDCTRTRQGFIKDVSKLGKWDMMRLVWVDDVRANFRLCPHNGIEIKPFKGEEDDRELEKLTPLLLKLSQAADVTELLWNGQPRQQEKLAKQGPRNRRKALGTGGKSSVSSNFERGLRV